MINKPTSDISWAVNTEIDAVNQSPNKIEPDIQLKNSGLIRNQDLARGWYNWQIHEMSKYIQWLTQEVDSLNQRVAILEQQQPGS